MSVVCCILIACGVVAIACAVGRWIFIDGGPDWLEAALYPLIVGCSIVSCADFAVAAVLLLLGIR